MHTQPFSVIVLSRCVDALLDATVRTLVASGNIDVHVLTADTRIPRTLRRLLASAHVYPPDEQDDLLLARVEELARNLDVPALLPVRLPDVAWVSKYRSALRFAKPVVTPDPVTLQNHAGKRAFAETGCALELPVPETLPVAEGMDPCEVVSRLGLPLIGKPDKGEAGIGMAWLGHLDAVARYVTNPAHAETCIVQSFVQGEDVALTLLADRGKSFAIALKKRWYTPSRDRLFAPICNVEFIDCPWLLELGQTWVERTGFSGIADFDLRVDFHKRNAWFLECDPRLMGSVASTALFGVNVPRLLVDHALGRIPAGSCRHTTTGTFLSLRLLPKWILSGAWRQPHAKPMRTNWRAHLLHR